MVILKDALNNLEYDDEEVKTLTEKFTNTAYWKDTGSKMPINPEKVLTGMDYHHKGHHFNLKRVSLEKPAPPAKVDITVNLFCADASYTSFSKYGL